jgi:hypothetical protein
LQKIGYNRLNHGLVRNIVEVLNSRENAKYQWKQWGGEMRAHTDRPANIEEKVARLVKKSAIDSPLNEQAEEKTEHVHAKIIGNCHPDLKNPAE